MKKLALSVITWISCILFLAACGRATPTPAPTPTEAPSPTVPPTTTPTPVYLWEMEFIDVYRYPYPDGEMLTLRLILHNRLAADKTFRAAGLTLRNAAHQADFPAFNAGEYWRVPANGAQEMTWQFLVAPGAAGGTTILIRDGDAVNLGEWADLPVIIPTPTPTLTPSPTRTPRRTATPETTPTAVEDKTAWLVSADGVEVALWTDVQQTVEQARFPSGTQVRILSQHEEFYLVIVGVQQGWVHQSFISRTAP